MYYYFTESSAQTSSYGDRLSNPIKKGHKRKRTAGDDLSGKRRSARVLISYNKYNNH